MSTGLAFKQLPPAEQQRYRDIVGELMAFAQEHAIPMCFAPPLVTAVVPLSGGGAATIKLPQTLGKIDGASGCVLRMPTGSYFITAEHVLRSYEERTREGERLNWQIGRLAPFDPLSRVAWRDKTDASDRSLMPYRPTDIAFLRLSEIEAISACGAARIIPCPGKWPPTVLSEGQLIVIAGYPNQLRAVDLAGTMNREACGLVFQVTSVGEGNCKCQFAYADLIDFGGGTAQPDLNTANLGGMSGCPVFTLASAGEGSILMLPRLAGVFTSRWGSDPTGDIIEIATFDNVRETDLVARSAVQA